MPSRLLAALTRIAVFIVIPGCAGALPAPYSDRSPDREALLSGTALFGTPVAAEEVAPVEALGVSDAMRAFIARDGLLERSETARLNNLLRRLRGEGYFDSLYEAEVTNGAVSTFESRTGNCLSFTNMFIALAREAGLDAHYQRVDVPAIWDIDQGLLIRSNHINVLVSGARYGFSAENEFTVDFNTVAPPDIYHRYVVPDEHAQALVYANLAVARMREGDYRESFAYQKRALELDPDNDDHWVNLGVIYTRAGDDEHAIDAFAIALKLDPDNDSGYAGLAHVYRKRGELEVAERYEAHVAKVRHRNPFFHFAVARAAYDRDDFPAADAAISEAIKRGGFGIGGFHLMKALVQFERGDAVGSKKSLRRAERFGDIGDLVRVYRNDVLTMRLVTAAEVSGERTDFKDAWCAQANDGESSAARHYCDY